MNAPFDFQGMTMLVTGGSRGLGFAMAQGFANHGARVIVASRDDTACAEAAARIEAHGGSAAGFALDVGDWAALEQAVEAVWSRFGGVDVLVNSAGLARIDAGSSALDEATFDALLAVNLKGPFRLTTLVAARMAAGAGGSVINISSLGAVRPLPAYGAYAATKAALNAITRAHAFEFAPKVRVNAILPGAFETELAESWSEERKAEPAAALGRNGRPEEIVTTALYLASPASAFTTGALINVDGGRV